MAAKAEPNVVPLCDVLLVLLIIFMVITPSVQRGMDAKLPETTADSASAPDVIVLTLHKDGKVDINRTFYERDLLESQLMNIYGPRQHKTMLIRADARVLFGQVIEMMDVARGAGVEEIGIVLEYIEEEDEGGR
ncbi:MAG: biopolymer transporter ExbD [Candidatus Aminicenantes bacterium]|nr:biopolymer transporter ExbD [Candidatus Aminicenantes bacterium]MDH5466122.1 biopolymer transporter ExbD [Candidatus Aminicenantes bacterium]MDH5704467.1 biopolymer transporter ExbD [Candidatus Aminicenantes bacterium]